MIVEELVNLMQYRSPKLNFELRKVDQALAWLLLCWYMSYFKHIGKIERLEISILLRKGYSAQDIATEIGRHQSTIYREIRRNAVSGEYLSAKAHHKSYVRLIRRYVPKSCDISKYSQKDIWDIQHRINGTPRKILGFKTAKEVFSTYKEEALHV